MFLIILYSIELRISVNNENAFGRRPTTSFEIDIETLMILYWNDLDLKMTLRWPQQGYMRYIELHCYDIREKTEFSTNDVTW